MINCSGLLEATLGLPEAISGNLDQSLRKLEVKARLCIQEGRSGLPEVSSGILEAFSGQQLDPKVGVCLPASSSRSGCR